MIRLAKRFDFDAAHNLPLLPEGHKCRRPHGHTYVAEIRLVSIRALAAGMLVDYAEVAKAWEPIHQRLDHRNLNEVEGLGNPTTEVLARWIFEQMRGSGVGHLLEAVRVYESSTTWCEYIPSAEVSGPERIDFVGTAR